MPDNFIKKLRIDIIKRALTEGGFASIPDGDYRPDATAWAVLALEAIGSDTILVGESRKKLALGQLDDGRVSLSKEHEKAFWPTALAVMAWSNSAECREFQLLGIDFLLKTKGKHFQKKKEFVTGHDTSICGWPWIDETHSWVEPTSLVLLALEATGNGDHERAREARRMLLDRQLHDGGWNYGNTTVFGRQLRPMPESTGLALNAIAKRINRKDVEKSIFYLKQEMNLVKTPLSFSWGFLGLSAWDERPQIDENSLIANYRRRETIGVQRTEELCLVVICMLSRTGLLGLFKNNASGWKKAS